MAQKLRGNNAPQHKVSGHPDSGDNSCGTNRLNIHADSPLGSVMNRRLVLCWILARAVVTAHPTVVFCAAELTKDEAICSPTIRCA